MPRLLIYERPSDSLHPPPSDAEEAWPDTSQLEKQSIEEAGKYIFCLQDITAPRRSELYLNAERLEPLRSPDNTTALWKWEPGFHAGEVEVFLQLAPGETVQFELVTDPDERKLTRERFTTMVEEILEDTLALFSLTGFRKGIGSGDGTTVPDIAQLEFLRSRIEKIESVVENILSRPLRVLQSKQSRVRVTQTRRATGPELSKSLRSSTLRRTEKGTGPGFLPEKIDQNRRERGYNIREHQDIKRWLNTWSSWLMKVHRQLCSGNPSPNEVRYSRICRHLASRLRRLLDQPLFQEVDTRQGAMTATPIFRKVPRYREFFRLHRSLNLGIARVTGDFLKIPLSRTYDLYEVWCYLRLLRIIVKRKDSDQKIGGLFESDSNGDELVVTISAENFNCSSDYSICFKRKYTEYWINADSNGERGSYSREMEPDISLTLPTENTRDLIVLDSKYRIKKNLNEALSSIHMYRDALVHSEEAGPPVQDSSELPHVVAGAYLLSPLSIDTDEKWTKEGSPDRFFHPEYRSGFHFGAVTMQPGMDDSDIEAALESIIRDVDDKEGTTL